MDRRKRVLIAYKSMPHYRIDFFCRLKEALKKENIDLDIVYGNSKDYNRKDEMKLEWAIYRPNYIFRVFKRTFYWQPIFDLIRKKDLVIVEQANALIINYILIFTRHLLGFKFAFWGHGKDRQSDENTFSAWIKRKLIKKCDYWFAYTSSVEQYLIKWGYNRNNISVVNNTLDTEKIHNELLSISLEERASFMKQLNVNQTNDIAIYCGSLYSGKRIDFLIESAELVYQQNNSFRLIIIGSGDDVDFVKQQTQQKPWLLYTGPKFGKEKAAFFSIAKVFLMPGNVGLAAIDSFCYGVPMVICELDTHGPEVDYLIDGNNCVFTKNDKIDFAEKVGRIIKDSSQLELLKNGCRSSLQQFTLENMVTNFIEGIKNCLRND